MRMVYAAACCVLAAIYGWTGYLAQNPRVDFLYRAYYIDKTLRRWNHGEGIGYQLGSQVDFSQSLPFLSNKGWSHPEAWGTWSMGTASTLFFTLDRATRPSQIRVTGQPFLVPGNGLAEQKIKAFANDLFLGEVALTSPNVQEIAFAVPPSLVLRDGDGLAVRFEYSDPKSPKSLGVSDDTRRLAFGFRRLVIQ